jgi:hypothetical protein
MTCHDKPNRSVSQPHRFRPAAPGQQGVPIVVDLVLSAHAHEQRERVRVRVTRAAVDSLHGLPGQVEGGSEQRSVGQALLVAGAGVAEDRAVELDRLIEVAVEPDKWGDGGHVMLLSFAR